MTRLIVGPFNRVEGDLEVRLDMADGAVRRAEVVSPMYRGFENLLRGRDPMDALVIVPRICGICSVSQSLAAARALAALAGVTPPPNGQLALNLLAATENAADHLTHFYAFFMPDFARPVYAGRPWHAEALRRHAAEHGEQTRRAIAARARWFELVGVLGGRWPHTHSLQPGGSSRAIDAAERLRLLARVREFRAWLEQQLVGAPLEQFTALPDEAALHTWAEGGAGGDLRLFLAIAADAGLAALGRGPGRALSVGAFPDAEGRPALAPGWWCEGQPLQPLSLDRLTEDATHAWLADAGGPLHPSTGLTEPDPDKPGAYTWNKAPRLAGQTAETGAVARQLADGQPLVADLARRHGITVLVRVVARLVELARLVPLMEAWLQALVPREPFAVPLVLPTEGAAVGLNEAARGSLGHWLRVEGGRLAHYQIVAPTSWNFSPRDGRGQPGPLEQALEGTPVRPGEATPVAVQHVVRSFDPCMVCTVH